MEICGDYHHMIQITDKGYNIGNWPDFYVLVIIETKKIVQTYICIFIVETTK